MSIYVTSTFVWWIEPLFLIVLAIGCPRHVYAEQPTLVWAYMAEAEPICWEEDGVAKGVDVEIVNHILGKLGIKVEHRFFPWERAQWMVKTGRADAMVTTPTAARFKYSAFGKENVVPNYWNLFIRKGDSSMAANVAGFTGLEDMKQYSLIDFICNPLSNAFMKICNGYDTTDQEWQMVC